MRSEEPCHVIATGGKRTVKKTHQLRHPRKVCRSRSTGRKKGSAAAYVKPIRKSGNSCISVLAALLLVLIAAGQARAKPKEVSNQASCLLAEFEGERVTIEDARNLKALLSPAPSSAPSTRLAVDIALAYRMENGSLGSSSAHERLGAYRRLILLLGGDGPSSELLQRLRDKVHSWRDQLGLRWGPCYVPLASGGSAAPTVEHDSPDSRGSRGEAIEPITEGGMS